MKTPKTVTIMLPTNLPPVVAIIMVKPELQIPKFKFAGKIFAIKAESTLSRILQATNKMLQNSMNFGKVEFMKPGMFTRKMQEIVQESKRIKIIFRSGWDLEKLFITQLIGKTKN